MDTLRSGLQHLLLFWSLQIRVQIPGSDPHWCGLLLTFEYQRWPPIESLCLTLLATTRPTPQANDADRNVTFLPVPACLHPLASPLGFSQLEPRFPHYHTSTRLFLLDSPSQDCPLAALCEWLFRNCNTSTTHQYSSPFYTCSRAARSRGHITGPVPFSEPSRTAARATSFSTTNIRLP